MILRFIPPFAAAVLCLAALPLPRACAHGVVIGRSTTGQLRAVVEGEPPLPLPPSIFPDIEGFAAAEPGIASAEEDLPEHDLFRLSLESSIEFELVSFQPGLQVVTSHVWVAGERLLFGPPFFDYHLIFNIPHGHPGEVYSLQYRLRDVNGIHADSPTYTLSFTPEFAQCECVGDTDEDSALSADDIGPFIDCLAESHGPPDHHCACSDLDQDGHIDHDDVAMLVYRLLRSDACP